MKYNKKISDFLFDMITRDDYPYISNFGSQEDLNLERLIKKNLMFL